MSAFDALTVVVTGGASGLGEATARHLASLGAKVAIFDRDAARGEAVAAELPGGAIFRSVDVTDDESVGASLDAAIAAFGGLRAVVNCAGIVHAARTVGKEGAHPLDAYRRVVDVNLTGTFNVMRLAAERMQANDPDEDGARGVIVNTASVAAFEGQKGQVAYAASKGGIAAMTLPAARDLARAGIRVNAIAPGLFRTPLFDSLGEAVCAELAEDVVFPPRLGRPEEFARLAAFLIGHPYMNGETVRLDGGLRLP